MAITTAIVGFDGELILPPEVQRTLGIAPGSHVDIVVNDGHVEITPKLRTPIDKERARKALQDLQAMFVGQPSLEDEYFRDREKDKW